MIGLHVCVSVCLFFSSTVIPIQIQYPIARPIYSRYSVFRNITLIIWNQFFYRYSSLIYWQICSDYYPIHISEPIDDDDPNLMNQEKNVPFFQMLFCFWPVDIFISFSLTNMMIIIMILVRWCWCWWWWTYYIWYGRFYAFFPIRTFFVVVEKKDEWINETVTFWQIFLTDLFFQILLLLLLDFFL